MNPEYYKVTFLDDTYTNSTSTIREVKLFKCRAYTWEQMIGESDEITKELEADSYLVERVTAHHVRPH